MLEFAKELLLGVVKTKNGDGDADKDMHVENPFPNGLMYELVQKLNNKLRGDKIRNINEPQGLDNIPKPIKSVWNNTADEARISG